LQFCLSRFLVWIITHLFRNSFVQHHINDKVKSDLAKWACTMQQCTPTMHRVVASQLWTTRAYSCCSPSIWFCREWVNNFQNATSLSCKRFNSIFLSKTWLDFPLKLHQLKPSQSPPDSLSWEKKRTEKWTFKEVQEKFDRWYCFWKHHIFLFLNMISTKRNM